MSENEILNKCAKTFPGIEDERSFGLDHLRSSLKLSERPTPVELAAASIATKPLADDFKITGVESTAKLAQIARKCSESFEKNAQQKSNEKFAADLAEKADLLLADGILRNGSSNFTPVHELSGKPYFSGHKEVRPHAEWSPPHQSEREEAIVKALGKLPNVTVHVFQGREADGTMSMRHDVVPKFYIGIRRDN